VKLETTIPALPVRSVAEAVPFYRDRLGFDVVHHGGGFAVLDQDGNLISSFEWVGA
jgi:catechol 2,3-dioxygenase-like lactoylglutathione lyase family enzyme